MIKQESIEALKSVMDIVDVIGSYVQLKKQGSNFAGLCPFHSEKSPSFIINPAKQFYHCFGCGASGDSIKFLMEIDRLSYPEAIEKLADKYNFTLQYSERKDKFINRNILEKINSYYKENLYKHKIALNYLKERGLSENTIEKFQLGFAPSSSAQIKFLNDVTLPIKDATELGIFAQGDNGVYARLIDRITFPIFNSSGKIIAYGGRTITNHPAKYINYSNTRIFNKSKTFYGLNFARDKILKSNQAIIVEGYMDVIMLHQGGFNNSIATLGTALTPLHLPELKKLDCKVILAYDGDNAGIEAGFKASKLLAQNNFDGGIVIFEKGKDPADMIKESLDITSLFNNPTTFIDFIILHISKKYDLKNPNQKEKFVNEIKEFIYILPELIKDDIRLKVSQQFQINSLIFKGKNRETNITNENVVNNKINIGEASIIKTSYENRDLLDYLSEHISLDMFSTHKKELDLLFQEKFDDNNLIDLIMNEKIEILNELELKNQINKILITFYDKEMIKLKYSNIDIKQKSQKLKQIITTIRNLKKGIL